MKNSIRYSVVFILILLPKCIYGANNIYEDAISHFIEEIVNKIELTNIKATNDSMYHHTLIFESNYSLNDRIPDTIDGFKILKLSNIKNHLDTCKNGWIPIFTIDKIDYCEKCTVNFGVTFRHFVIKKEHDKLNLVGIEVYVISYDYESETKKFVYRYCDSGVAPKELIKIKGWFNGY